MTPFLIILAIVWLLVTAGMVARLVDAESSDPAPYAVAVFWPLFLVIFLIRGLFKALWHIND